MDWKLFFTTFGLIFLAELGDKTQLAALGLTAKSKNPLVVFLSASLALVVATLIGVLIGDALVRFIPELWLKRGVALLFILVGFLLWFKIL